jgi:NAD(P)-dependent dehydrogenase (short-subunit alcohol dehydrogenase family)
MRKRRSGHIVYVSSVVGRVAVPLLSAYAASKWALEAIAETLALEVSAFDVNVSVVEPGAVSPGASASPLLLPPAGDPYGHLYGDLASVRGQSIRPEDVAEAIAGLIDDPGRPFRKPVGKAALGILARRQAHPDGEPFRAAAT